MLHKTSATCVLCRWSVLIVTTFLIWKKYHNLPVSTFAEFATAELFIACSLISVLRRYSAKNIPKNINNNKIKKWNRFEKLHSWVYQISYSFQYYFSYYVISVMWWKFFLHAKPSTNVTINKIVYSRYQGK